MRRVGGGGIDAESSLLFGVGLIVDSLLFLFCELWIEGLVLPFFLNSDNGGTSEVAGEVVARDLNVDGLGEG